jgi:hypothetical protein
VDTNRVILLFADGLIEPLDLMNKDQVAAVVMARVEKMLQQVGL